MKLNLGSEANGGFKISAAHNRLVVGSIPTGPTNPFAHLLCPAKTWLKVRLTFQVSCHPLPEGELVGGIGGNRSETHLAQAVPDLLR